MGAGAAERRAEGLETSAPVELTGWVRIQFLVVIRTTGNSILTEEKKLRLEAVRGAL